MSVDPLIGLFATGLIAVVFARAIFEKAGNYGVYVGALRDYRLAPPALAPLAAAMLLVAEILTLGALLFGPTRAAGAAMAAGLLALYALAISLALAAGRTQIECGCGGDGQQVSWALVGRNGALVALCALVLAPAASRALAWPDFAEAGLAILIGWIALAAAEKIIDNAAAVRRLRSESFL
jgi:hypothetical protein